MLRWININLLSSFDCNLNCSYCVHKSENQFNKNKFSGQRLSVVHLIRLKDLIERFKHPDIECNIQINGGEPTLDWKYFYDYVSILSTIKGCRLELITNLSGDYSEEQFRFLIDVFDSIGVSIDGKRETHDASRGPGSFDKTMDNFAYLHALAPNKVTINSTVTEANVDKMFENIKFFKFLRINHTHNIDFFTPKKDAAQFIEKYISQLVVAASEFGPSVIPIPTNPGGWYCMDRTLAITVYPNGQVLHCNSEYDSNKVMFDLNTPNYFTLNETAFNNIPTNHCVWPEHCPSCEAYKFCKNGCYAAIKENKDVFCSIMIGIAKLKEKMNEGDNNGNR